MARDEFLSSDEGLRILYVTRLVRRFRFQVDAVEPRSKNAMPLGDKITLQRSILQQMGSRRRRAFRGALALNIRATTTEKTPSHAQTIAKNLLDLLGQPLPDVGCRHRGILYYDDRQVRALSVSVQHGASSPGIAITAARYADFLDDLSLACHAEQRLGPSSQGSGGTGDLENIVLGGLSLDSSEEHHLRMVVGNAASEAFLASLESFRRTERYMAQKELLSTTPFSLLELAVLLGAPLQRAGVLPSDDPLFREIEETTRSHPLRVRLPELPEQSGDSKMYRHVIGERLEEFQDRFAHILRPLLHPVAMEVVVKPPPLYRHASVRDLDNLARNHLIPAVAARLQPPFYDPWTVARGKADINDVDLTAGHEKRRRDLVKAALIGLTRYTIFEQARASGESSPGSVTLSLVGAEGGFGEVFTRIDLVIDDWEQTL